MRDPPADEAAWPERIRAGDEAAFEALFRAYHARLLSFAASMVGDRETAEEIIQTVFLNVWAKRASFRPASVRAYLYAAARNGALNVIARRGTETRWQAEITRAEMMKQEASDQTIDRMEAERSVLELRRALESLPPRCRQVLDLRWQHQLKHAEIAEALGISVKAVEKHVAHGLAVLRERLR